MGQGRNSGTIGVQMKLPRLLSVGKILAVSAVFAETLGWGNNLLVIRANGGFMPVYWPEACGEPTPDGYSLLLDFSHVCMSRFTHLNWLADWISIGTHVFSPADLLVYYAQFVAPVAVLFVVLGLIQKKFSF